MNHAGIFEEFAEALGRAYQMEELNLLSDFWKGTFRILTYLCNHQEEEVYPATLSDALHVSRSRITSSLASLQQKGLIETEGSQKDGRRVIVRLTEAGNAFYERKRRDALQYVQRLTEQLGEENLAELTRLVNLCVDVAKKNSGRRKK